MTLSSRRVFFLSSFFTAMEFLCSLLVSSMILFSRNYSFLFFSFMLSLAEPNLMSNYSILFSIIWISVVFWKLLIGSVERASFKLFTSLSFSSSNSFMYTLLSGYLVSKISTLSCLFSFARASYSNLGNLCTLF